MIAIRLRSNIRSESVMLSEDVDGESKFLSLPSQAAPVSTCLLSNHSKVETSR